MSVSSALRFASVILLVMAVKDAFMLAVKYCNVAIC